MERVKKLSSQLGHKIPDMGIHMPSAAVGILKKKRKKGDAKYMDAKTSPGAMEEHNPFPHGSHYA